MIFVSKYTEVRVLLRLLDEKYAYNMISDVDIACQKQLGEEVAQQTTILTTTIDHPTMLNPHNLRGSPVPT